MGRRRSEPKVACAKCGYDLAGIATDAPCPECGAAGEDARAAPRGLDPQSLLTGAMAFPVAMIGLIWTCLGIRGTILDIINRDTLVLAAYWPVVRTASSILWNVHLYVEPWLAILLALMMLRAIGRQARWALRAFWCVLLLNAIAIGAFHMLNAVHLGSSSSSGIDAMPASIRSAYYRAPAVLTAATALLIATLAARTGHRITMVALVCAALVWAAPSVISSCWDVYQWHAVQPGQRSLARPDLLKSASRMLRNAAWFTELVVGPAALFVASRLSRIRCDVVHFVRQRTG